jgi:hypothetical protein
MKKLGEGKKDRRIWTGAVRMGKDRKGRTPPDVLKRRMKERKERDIQDRKNEDTHRKIEMRGDDDIFLSDDEKVQAALKQLDRLAEDCQSILEEDSVTVSHTLQSSATNAEEYDEAAEEEIEDMHGCLRRCLHGGFPQFMGQEPPPTSSCPCYNCCMASLTPEFSEVTHEGDHEENDNAGIDDEREEGMHDADDDVEEESQSLPLQCGCRHCCMLKATFLAKAAAATAE